MSIYLVANDLHLADRPPSMCQEGYAEDLFTLLGELGDQAAAHAAAAVIFTGDVFHNKAPGRTAHATTMRLIARFREYPCPVLIVAGNHDLQHDRIASLAETQPLGVVFAAEAAHLLVGFSARDAGIVSDDIYGACWLPRYTDEHVTEHLAHWRACANQRPRLLAAHAPLYPPGRELSYEHYPVDRWAQAMGGTGTCAYGHVHEPHGIYTHGGVRFANPGALSRGSLHEHNLTRAVQVLRWDSSTDELSTLELPHKPASEVFRLAEARVKIEAGLRLDEFLASVGSARLESASIEAIVAHIRTLDIDRAVADLAEQLLTDAVAA